MKNKLLILLTLPLILSGCGETRDEDDHSSSSSSTTTSSSGSDSESSSSESNVTNTSEETEIKTVLTKDWGFAKGNQFANTDYPANNALLVEHFNNALGNKVTGINCTTVTSGKYGVNDSDTMLCIGSQNFDGSMTISFSKKVYSATLNVSNYYTSYEDHWSAATPFIAKNIDENSEVGIGVSSTSLTKTKLPKIDDNITSKTLSYEFSGGTNTLVVASFGCDKDNSKPGRVYVASIELVIAK